MTTAIVEALRKRYPGSAYALITELRNQTGHAKGNERYADAVVMGCWPSRGLEVEGFEFKSYRGDWLNELKNPEKAEAFFGYCDKFWLVEGEKGIAKVEEVPKTWGLLTYVNGTLKVTVQAPKLKPKEPDRSFIASLLRSFVNQSVTKKQITKARDAGYQEGIKEGEKVNAMELDHCRRTLERIQKDHQKVIDDFERVSGVRITQYNAGSIGDAVRRVMNGEHLQIEDRMRRLKDVVDGIKGHVDEAIKRAEIKGWDHVS